jgi:hypothetical protein
MTFTTVKTCRKSAPFQAGYPRLATALSVPLKDDIRVFRPRLPPAPSPFLTVGIPSKTGHMGFTQLVTEKMWTREVGVSGPVGVIGCRRV